MIPPVHPFPARMAPELALSSLERLESESLVLDSFAGSGTVLRHATELGHRAVGFDLDPLSVLMTRVWTTPVADDIVEDMAQFVLDSARELHRDDVVLPWIEDDEETGRFVRYWFGRAVGAHNPRVKWSSCAGADKKERAAANLLRIALSRTIITKDQGASLARDVSHSRPHRVTTSSP